MGKTRLETPSGPYCIKSKKSAKEGKSIDKLMFDNFPYVLRVYKKILDGYQGGDKHSLHQHLDWLWAQGKNRKPKMICPRCGQKPVAYFSKITSSDGGVSIGKDFTCCDSPKCMDVIDRMSVGKDYELRPFHFQEMSNVRYVADAQNIGILFRTVFGLPKRLTKERAFAFFAEDAEDQHSENEHPKQEHTKDKHPKCKLSKPEPMTLPF